MKAALGITMLIFHVVSLQSRRSVLRNHFLIRLLDAQEHVFRHSEALPDDLTQSNVQLPSNAVSCARLCVKEYG